MAHKKNKSSAREFLEFLAIIHLIPFIISGIIYSINLIKIPWLEIFLYIYIIEFIIMIIIAYFIGACNILDMYNDDLTCRKDKEK